MSLFLQKSSIRVSPQTLSVGERAVPDTASGIPAALADTTCAPLPHPFGAALAGTALGPCGGFFPSPRHRPACGPVCTPKTRDSHLAPLAGHLPENYREIRASDHSREEFELFSCIVQCRELKIERRLGRGTGPLAKTWLHQHRPRDQYRR